MSDADIAESNAKDGTASAKQQPPKRISRLLIGWTLLVLIGLTYLHWQSRSLNENYRMDPAIPSLLTYLFGLLTIYAWSFWAFFLGRRRLVGIFLFLLPTLFLTFYYPNVRGDANIGITDWQPRFWKRNVEYTEVAAATSGVDLNTTTPADFPQFLGADRDASVQGVNLESDWSANPPRLIWKHGIGEGWSGFVAVNGFAITQEQRDAEECVTCYDIETGELKWLYAALRRHEDTMAMGKVGPRATPTIYEGLVYTTSGTGVLDCLNGSDGSLVWTADVPALVGIQQVPYSNSRGLEYTMEDSAMAWGRSCSPLVYEDKVIVPAGGPLNDTNNQTCTLIAFDRLTGEEIWRGGNRMIAYGSPSVATVLGQQQILLVAEAHAVGHDPTTGKELWSHEREGVSSANANCSQVTYVSDSQLLLSKGYSMGGELIELSKDDGQFKIEVLHKDPRILKTKLTNPVIYDGHVYSLSDGYLECTELKSFQRKWKQRGRFGNGQVLLVGNKLLVHTEWGQLLLIDADPSEYRELGSIPTIDGICWNTLCLYGNKLLVRSEIEAACFELPLAAGNAAKTTDE